MKKKKIALTGGGTGGHIWPLIPLAKRLGKDYKVIFIGQKGGPEEKIAKDNGLDFRPIEAAKLQGFSQLNPLTYIKQLVGICQAYRLFKKEKVDLIFAKGGFVAFPVCWAGFLRNLPLVLHESDSIIGRSNRWLVPLSFRFLTNFPKKYYPQSLKGKIIRVGIPLREQFKESNLPRKLSVLFMGGSQGSVFINGLVKELFADLVDRVEIRHICGPDNLEEMKKFRDRLSKEQKEKYKLVGRTDKIADWMKKSSLIVSRSGATTLVEIAKIKRPVILIPFPYAANDHQKKNGQILEQKEAVEIVYQSKKARKELKVKINQLLDDLDKRHKLADNLNDFLAIDSLKRTERIIKSIL